MAIRHAFQIVTFILILTSCKKEQPTNPPATPPAAKKVLLKDIVIPNLPSPYYHFEYNPDSTVSKANFASGLAIYDYLYSGNRIAEIRNNFIATHNTLGYLYDNTGKVSMIKFTNEAGVLYRHASFTYTGNQLTGVKWDHKDSTAAFVIDRTVSLTYYPDGNLKDFEDHRPVVIEGQPESNSLYRFENYDNKTNVDAFSLLHDGIHDHLFLLPGVIIQKNNPGKETRTGTGDGYTEDYTYTYNSNNEPLTKDGVFSYTSGTLAGKKFETKTIYSYY